MLRFEPIDHPSDIGIRVYGNSLIEIFQNAASGMFSLMTDPGKVQPREKVKIEVAGEDYESLLINWLNELIYLEDTRKILFCDFKIQKLSPSRLEALAAGEKIDLKRHQIFRPIKAATFNQLQIGPKEAKIVFDV